MKKLIAISIALLLALGITTLSYAGYQDAEPSDPISLYTNKSISVRVIVPTVFGFELWPNEDVQTLWPYHQLIQPDPNVDYKVDPAFGSLHILVSSNYGTAWTLSAAAPLEGVVKAGGTATIPLKFATWLDRKGGLPMLQGQDTKLIHGTPNVKLESTPKQVYRANNAAEFNVSRLLIPALFFADLENWKDTPDSPTSPGGYNTPTAGAYTGSIVLFIAR